MQMHLVFSSLTFENPQLTIDTSNHLSFPPNVHQKQTNKICLITSCLRLFQQTQEPHLRREKKQRLQLHEKWQNLKVICINFRQQQKKQQQYYVLPQYRMVELFFQHGGLVWHNIPYYTIQMAKTNVWALWPEKRIYDQNFFSRVLRRCPQKFGNKWAKSHVAQSWNKFHNEFTHHVRCRKLTPSVKGMNLRCMRKFFEGRCLQITFNMDFFKKKKIAVNFNMGINQ